MSIWQGAYWKAQTERAVASAAGAAVSVIGADAIFNAVQADWQAIGSIALGAAVVSVLKGLAANAVTGTGPGLTGAEVTRAVPDGPGDRRAPYDPTRDTSV